MPAKPDPDKVVIVSEREPLLRDISVTLNPDTPEWPGDTPFTCGWASSMAAGASVNVSSFTSSPHVGTHADAPLHVREGWSGSHELSLDAFFGPAIVVDVSTLSKEIDIEELEKIQSLPFVERLLLLKMPGGPFEHSSVDALAENMKALLDAVNKSRPPGIKGIYLKKVSVSSTMGVGVRVDQGSMQG